MKKEKTVLMGALVATALLGSYTALAADNVAGDVVEQNPYHMGSGFFSTELGYNVNAAAPDSIAIGTGAMVAGTNPAVDDAGNVDAGATYPDSTNESGFNRYAGWSGVAIGSNSFTNVESGVALGSYSVADRQGGLKGGYDPSTQSFSTDKSEAWLSNSGAVSVGGVTTYTDENGVEVQNTISRQIINVAAGTEDSDAVNVAQLKKVVALTDTNKAAINTNKEAINANKDAIVANTDAINANALAIADTKQDVTAVNNRVSKLDDRMDKVGASAAALAALHPLQFDENNRFTVAAGFGNYKGEQAVALGGFYHANEDLLFSLGGTLGDENMVNAGVSVRFGEKSDVVNPAAPTAVRDLSNEVASLKAKNEGLESTVASQQKELTAQKDQLAKQAATLEAQQKVIEQLMAKVGL